MPASPVEIASEVIEAFNRRDVTAIAGLLAEGGRSYLLRSQLEGTVYVGPAGVREAWDELFEDWNDVRWTEVDYHEAAAGAVAVGRLHAVSAASGIVLDTEVALLFEVSGGKVDLMRSYSDPAAALDAAGIPDSLS